MNKVFIIIVLVILVILSGFFSGSEIVYAQVNKLKLKKLAEEGNRRAQAALNLAQNYPVLISTILIGNNLVNIAASSLATFLFYTENENGPLYAGFIIIGIILVFGEILPKTILSRFTTSISLLFNGLIRLFAFIFKPLVKLMTALINKLSKIWTPKVIEDEDISGEELKNMVDTIEEEGYIDDDTKELVTSAIELKETTAEEIMTPRVDVFSFDINDDIKEIIDDERLFKYSRILIYDEKVDNILGVIPSRKLILTILNDKKSFEKRNIDLRKMLIPPIFVHKTKSLISLLKTFKDTHTHIAIVVDEFGGTMGIITLEDLLEEIVGDIWDEMDEVEEEYEKEPDGTFVVDGDMNLDDLFELIGYENDDYECAYSTVAGWCTEILDDFPKINDTFIFENYRIIIMEVDGFRVEKVKIEIIPEEE